MLSFSRRNSLRAMFMLVLFVFSFLLSYNGVEGNSYLSREEELGIENQLKLLNKPANKSIKTEYGDIYDCVDFYKQPAFDHPLLKNHNFHPDQMRPSYLHKAPMKRNSTTENQSSAMKLKGGGCPVGTVPIRRITKEDLIREKLASAIRTDSNDPRIYKYAIARTKPGRYNGAGGVLSLYNPAVESQSYSAGQFKLTSGSDSIQAGWRVDPDLYGVYQTRFFIHTDAGQSHCFNIRCPGFVMVSKDIPIDGVFAGTTVPGKLVWESTAFITRNLPTGWWLQYGRDAAMVGFWPKEIFTGLGDVAESVGWGGEVKSPEGGRNPPMGSGINPYAQIEDYIHNIAYISKLSVVNEQFETVDPKELVLDSNSDDHIYDVRDMGYLGDADGHLIIYGGSG